MKVLHVPTNTGGNPQGLARAEREIGIEARAITLLQNRFDMDIDEVLWPDGTSVLQRLVEQIKLIRRAIRDYDVIHYNNGKTISALPLPVREEGQSLKTRVSLAAYSRYSAVLQRCELALIHRTKKPYFVTYQGSDARLTDYGLRNYDITHFKQPEGRRFRFADAHIRNQINLLTRSANKVYALNPDLLNTLPKSAEFLPYASVDLREWRPNWQPADRPLIAHAPSRSWVKGTKYILSAVDQLRGEGFQFDFQLIENVSHAEAKRQYEAAHLMIDQLLVGWYGALSVELMALGKPVICYLRHGDLDHIPPEMREAIPIVQATPETIGDVLRNWLKLPMEKWYQRGQQSRKYVEQWHDPRRIAERLCKDYQAALNRTSGSR